MKVLALNPGRVCAGRRGDVLALLAGVILVSAFAPLGLAPVAVVAPALLFLCWHDLAPRRAGFRGWLFGLGLFGTGASWVFVSFYRFGDAPLPVALLLTLAFVAFLALFPAALGYLWRRGLPQGGAAGLLLFLPAAWTLLEWVRGWLFSGFPWLNLGYSQTDTPLAAFAPLTGVYGMSWLTALTAALLAWLLTGAWRRKIAALLAGLAIWTGALLLPVDWTRPGQSLTVRLVQGNIPQERKWLPEELRPTLARYRSLTLEPLAPVDLVVWPETAIPAFYHWLSATYLSGLGDELRNKDMGLLTGIAIRDPATQADYNGVIALGRGQGEYHKRHLVPFGEYLPFKPVLRFFGNIINVPMDDFTPGEERQSLIEAAGVSVATSICYEAVFGEEIIRDLPRAQLLVNLSNDAWFGRSLAPHQQLQITRLRARETGRYLLRATNTGITAIIDRHGRVVARLPMFETAVLDGRVETRTGATPYVRFGNAPVLFLLLLSAGLGWGLCRAREARKITLP